MVGLYDSISQGQLARIKGRNAVYLYYASYGGGSGPLWAIEGEAFQFTTEESWGYQKGRCIRVTSLVVVLAMPDGQSVEIPLGQVQRFDQHHLPHGERFEFRDNEIELM